MSILFYWTRVAFGVCDVKVEFTAVTTHAFVVFWSRTAFARLVASKALQLLAATVLTSRTNNTKVDTRVQVSSYRITFQTLTIGRTDAFSALRVTWITVAVCIVAILHSRTF